MNDHMGKKTKIAGIAGVAVGAAGAATFLAKSENRKKAKKLVDKIIKKKDPSSTINKIGRPADPPNAKMIDEGAMTSVQYFNELQEEYQETETDKKE